MHHLHSLFEALINAISCQQISLDAGLQIQNRLVQHIGIKMNYKNQELYAFPTAEDVSHCSIPLIFEKACIVQKMGSCYAA